MRENDSLKAEYLLIQGQYEDFDKRALSLKALATPLLGAGLAVGIKEHSATILAATVGVALTLWLLETIWKSFQYSFVPRIEALEAWFRGEGAADAIEPFQVYTQWNKSWSGRLSRYDSMLRVWWQPFVALPYLIIVLFGAWAIYTTLCG